MAQKIDLSTATSLEGQALMVIEALVNHQDDTVADTGKNRDNRQMISISNYNDLTGVYNVSMTIEVTSTQTANGITLIADELFYPKTTDGGS